MNKLGRSVIAALLLGGALALAGCAQEDTTTTGSGTPGVFGTGGGGGGGGGGAPPPPPPPPPVAGVPSLVLTLADPTTGATTTSAPATARAIVRDAAGVGVPSVVVTFTTNTALGTLIPASGTALTDATGTATVGLTAASLTAAGAATLTATSQVGTTAVTGSIGYSVGAANVTITNFAFGTNPLSAFGTTSVSVTVNSNGVPVTSPQTVTFSSPCAGSGKAVLTSSVLTGAGGVAIASYRDNGCGGTDVVTASVSGIANASLTLTVAAPTTGSIQFISATPTSITLKGTGGAGRQESSQVIFKVVDTGGNPIGGKTVTFSLSTSVGGITLTNTTATSDAITGQAVVTVNAGTVSTPVRVLASTVSGAVTLSTQSDQLTITTGIPAQASFSLSATTLNIEGWTHDGVTTVLTARLADHFSNAVPDGTTVNFIAEGGSVCNPLITPCLGACNTAAGACSVTMTSQNFRPLNGRVTVLGFAVGEESFTDIDGDGVASLVNHFNGTTEMVDANGAGTDTGEAFLDNNENGSRDFIGASTTALEEFIDFNSNGLFDGPDGKYNGVLCNDTTGTSSPGTCSAQRSIDVFRNLPIVFSGSDALVQFSDSSRNPITGISFPTCTAAAAFTPQTLTVLITVTDVNGNIMPAGTTVSFTTTNGTIQSTPTSFTVPNSAACLAGAGPGPSGFICPSSPGGTRCVLNVPAEGAGFICPTSSEVLFGNAPLTYAVLLKTQATQSGTAPGPFTCTAPSNSPGRLSVTVTTPKPVITTTSIPVTN